MTIYTAELRGYTFGCDEEWEWTGHPTLGLGQYRTQRADLIDRHGVAVAGGDFGSAGLITLPVELHMPGEPGEAEEAARRLRAAFAPQTDSDLVEMTVEMHSGSIVLRGRPLRPEAITDEFGTGSGLVQFETTDPLTYSSTPKSVSVTVAAAASGGMDTPMDTPMVTTSGGSTGDVTLTHDGTAPAPWQAFLVGPLTTPRLILGELTLTVDGTIAAGQTAVLDSRDGSLLVDGAPYPWVTVESEWWEIPPGSSTFSFRAAGGTGTALLSWRDASF